MGTVKTAISIQQSLYEQAEALARELEISRSRLFVLALESYVQRYQNRKLLTMINNAYEDEEIDSGEDSQLRGMRRLQRQVVEDEW